MKKILLGAVLILGSLAPVALSAKGPTPGRYRDYPALMTTVTGKLRHALERNPEATADSIRHNVLSTITDGPVGSARDLAPQRRKELKPTEIFDRCRRSALVFGKMEYVPFAKADSAYSNASAVALTADGIVATNYHVVADLVIDGSLGREIKGDKARFVMDYDGDVYPVTSVLYIDPINDLSIIRVDASAKPLTPAPLGPDLAPGSRVYCLSNPSGAYFHFTEGQVSNNTGVRDQRTGYPKYIMEITADYGVGASGGPIFDSCGNLAALVSSTFSLYAQPQQYRNFQMSYKQTVPVFLIRDLFAD
ncbi:MAG: trypsin-like peptidase domain-containing protein [Bacteroides sp.]|nr:trypsin-like peptidase domain-containing protein [Bacteroides sp.]MBD5270953.1 trypsin-like peptidase domain-containing protein [Bacteroides sp.]MBD5332827.1 trypsin-like peptidase domain-containing protein [Bacteroides sp.]